MSALPIGRTTGFTAFLRKEALEIRRTWRFWMLPGLLVFFAITSPILAKLTPNLLRSIAADTPGMVFQMPEPTALDAYRQFVKSAAQIVLIALLIVGASAVSGERRSGTLLLVLTKPVSRAAFILAKAVAQAAQLIVATALGVAVCLAVTAVIFPLDGVGRFVEASAAWLVLALWFLALVILCSVVVPAQTGAAGLALALYFAVTILASWGPARDWTPAGLLTAPNDLIDGNPTQLLWPLVTTGLTAALFLLAAIALFQRQELNRTGG